MGGVASCATCGARHAASAQRAACAALTKRSVANLGHAVSAKRWGSIDPLVLALLRYCDGGDILQFGRACKGNRRLVARLGQTPLARMHRELKQYGLADLPPLLRAFDGRLVGGLLARAISNGDGSSPAWVDADADVAIPRENYDRALKAVRELIVHHGGIIISATMQETHTTIRYSTSSGQKRAVDLFSRPPWEKEFPVDLTSHQ